MESTETTTEISQDQPAATEAPFGATPLPTDLEPHRYAEIFPAMPEDQIRELAADIKAHGLLDPIVIFEGKVLDGRHRLKASRLAGITPQIVTLEEYAKALGLPAVPDPLAFVASRNLKRRHLTKDETITMALRIADVYQADAQERMRAGAEVPPKRRGKALKFATAAAAASGADVKLRTVERARAIETKAPEIAERAKRGKITWAAARNQMHKLEQASREQGNQATAGPDDNKASRPLKHRAVATIAERFEAREKKHRPIFTRIENGGTRRVYATAYDGQVEFSRVEFSPDHDYPQIETFPSKFSADDLQAILAKLEPTPKPEAGQIAEEVQS